MLLQYVHKKIDEGLRLQLLKQTPKFLPGATFKLAGKALIGEGP